MQHLLAEEGEIREQVFEFKGKHLKYACAPRNSGQISIFLARVLWEGVGPLLRFLEALGDEQRLREISVNAEFAEKATALGSLADATVLELGAGVAIPSLFIASTRSFKSLTITDGDAEALKLIRHNFALNNLSQPGIEIARLDWHKDKRDCTYDLVIGSDLIYMAESLPSLVATIKRHLHPQGLCVLTNFYTRLSRNREALINLCAFYGLRVIIGDAGGGAVNYIFVFVD